MEPPKFIDIAEAILSEEPNKTAHIDRLADAAIATNRNMGMDRESIKSKLNSALAAAVKKQVTQFAKVPTDKGDIKNGPFRKGYYRLKIRRAIPIAKEQEAPKVDNLYAGKAGEYAVMSELLFWNFNPSLMTVDNGIDIVAEKNSTYYHLQVKTANESDGNWRFTIKTSSFEVHNKGATYYVFVLRHKQSNLFAVIPSSHIDIQRKHGIIKGEQQLSVVISTADKGKTWRINNKDNISLFMGAFGQIR